MASPEPVLAVRPALARRLPPRFPLTRGTGGSYIGANGLWQFAERDQPRIGFDGNGACRGVIIEPAATNLFPRNREFARASNYNLINLAALTIGQQAPDGSLSAAAEIEDATNSGRYFINANVVPFVSGTQYCSSRFCKYGTGAARYPGILLPNAVFGSNASAVFQCVGDGSYFIAGAGTNTSAGIFPVGNGWYLCWVSSQATASASNAGTQHRISNATNSTAPVYAGDGVSNVLWWGGQVEVGSYPTSFIDTPALASVSRAADSIVMPSINEYWNPNEGTLIWEGDFRGLTAGDNVTVLSDGSAANFMAIELNASTATTLEARLMTGSVEQALITLGTVAINTPYRAAIAWQGNDVQGALNGTLSAQDVAATLPASLTRLGIGDPAGSGGTTMNGACAGLRLWSKRLSNSLLQQLTT
jgi:hypothetical protein